MRQSPSSTGAAITWSTSRCRGATAAASSSRSSGKRREQKLRLTYGSVTRLAAADLTAPLCWYDTRLVQDLGTPLLSRFPRFFATSASRVSLAHVRRSHRAGGRREHPRSGPVP